MLIEVGKLSELEDVSRKILGFAADHKIFLFYGEMGAGKTTLIKSLCRNLLIEDSVSSPTFSIVNEYSSPSGSVYHFDFYRLKNETEALDIGYEDYIDSGEYCLIEWPEKIKNLIPDNHCKIKIEVTGEESRLLQIEVTN